MPEALLISVIDDDESIRQALDSMLAERGFRVACFGSAEDFLATDAVSGSALVVSDVQMPGMSGIELSRQLRTAGTQTPIILITAFATDAIRAVASRAGVACLIDKPFDPDDLLSQISASLGEAA